MQFRVDIVRTAEQLQALQLEQHARLVADVETFGTDPKNGKLLGVALCPLDGKFANGADAAYVVVQEYLYKTSEWVRNDGLVDTVKQWAMHAVLLVASLVGFNYCYDRGWLDHFFGIKTVWHADARLMWHMSEPADRTRSYGLKDAQVEVLGWPARGDAELEEMVKARGGSLKKGDHYLADTEVLGYYAGLDVISTAQLYNARKPFFDRHELWDLLDKMMRYSALLEENSTIGVKVDVEKLEKTVTGLKAQLDRARRGFVRETLPYVRKLVHNMRDHQAARYSSPSARAAFLADPTRWKKFNLSSDKQKRELFHDVMQLPVVQRVKPRKDPKTGRKVYSQSAAATIDAFTAAVGASGRHDLKGAVKQYAAAEQAEAILKGFALPMLKMVRGGRVHPRFNPCGTKSYRLSGYKPSFMNLPFDDRDLMSCFSCDEGWTGVHADLVSIEPAVTAHYSQDPSLLKIFVEGRGDVYLDLALTLFPLEDLDRYPEDVQAHILTLHFEYDPNAFVDEAVKDRHKLVRKVAKVVQLAVQYTGTEYTVSLNLTQAGFPTTLEQGREMVEAYWRHFARVAAMNQKLAQLHERRGFLRNAIGRVVRKSRSDDKDLPNLFFQSSAHDILTIWVLRIYELCAERSIPIRPMLADCHDSTSNATQHAFVEQLKQTYLDALADVNSWLRMSVPVRCEIKTFHTFAGLKGDDGVAQMQEAA